MEHFFLNIYQRISSNRKTGLLIFVFIILAAAFGASQLTLDEDINSIIPKDKRIDNITSFFSKSELSDQIVFKLSVADSTAKPQPDRLIEKAENIRATLQQDSSLIRSITMQISDDTFLQVYDFIYENLPLYLTETDYEHLLGIANTDSIETILKKDFKALISPSGMVTKKFIFKDPLSIAPRALKKLENFQLSDNFELHNSYIFTADKKHLLFFLHPKFPSNQTSINEKLIQQIDSAIVTSDAFSPSIKANYYGGTAVAVANAQRVKNDIVLTVSIAVVLLLLLFFVFFKDLKVIVVLFVPVLIGALLSLAVMATIDEQVSAISLGIGAILLGISIDFSLHAFTHFRAGASVRETIKSISSPVVMSALTTASTFLSLFVIRSQALQQLGQFAAVAIVASALAVLVLLPHIIGRMKIEQKTATKNTLIDKISAYAFHKNGKLILAIFIVSLVFAVSSRYVSFNSDIASLNYQPKHLAEAEQELQAISSVTNSAVYVVTHGKSQSEALEKMEKQTRMFSEAKEKGLVKLYSSATDLLVSEKLQHEKIARWNAFWNNIGREKLKEIIVEKGKKFHFKENAFAQFYELIQRDFSPKETAEFATIQETFLQNYVSETEGEHAVFSVLKVDREKKPELFKILEQSDELTIFDKQYFTIKFLDVLRNDFDKLVAFSTALVFLILLLSFGRIELAIVTFLPISISWLWTLGLMGMFNVEFNIFNIIISTFIFGLGVDYCIFLASGLLAKYKYGEQGIAPYKASILLSALTTIIGIGVLIFAKHPALKSIAAVSIFGIFSVVLITYTLLPLLFSFLTEKNGKFRDYPITASDLFVSVVTMLFFMVCAFGITALLPFFFLLPLKKKKKKQLMSYIIHLFSKVIVTMNITIKKDFIDKEKLDFSKPSVIVANHQSHLDLVLMLMLHPKMIVFTNKWVYNNIFYGFVVRYADFFPAYKGLETNMEKLKQKIDDGYSVLIFPEGSRSPDGKIKRFHQGALHVAATFGIPLQPILIHGSYECLPKTDFYMRSDRIAIKIMDKITVEPADLEKGKSYRKQTKELTAMFRRELETLKQESKTPNNIAPHLISRYILKGPVLEWYLRVKIRLEGNYAFFDEIIPKKGRIVDIGCGYGFLSYMLRQISQERQITGIDYDEEKIAVAKQVAANDPELNFVVQDITTGNLPDADVYVLNDVLHYLPEELQFQVIQACMNKLPENGLLIIRDADADLEERTNVTKLTEVQSTKIFNFNKTKHPLTFISGKKIEELSLRNELEYKRLDNAKFTSNVTHTIKRKGTQSEV